MAASGFSSSSRLMRRLVYWVADEHSATIFRHVTKYRHRHFVTNPSSPSAAAPSQKFICFAFKGPGPSAWRTGSLARAVLIGRAWRRTGQQVLRITVEEKPETVVLKLEGRLAGPWAAELGRFWQEKAPNVAPKKLSLDLREITFADAGGIRLLQDIYSQTGAVLLTGTPWTQYLAEEVTHSHS